MLSVLGFVFGVIGILVTLVALGKLRAVHARPDNLASVLSDEVASRVENAMFKEFEALAQLDELQVAKARLTEEVTTLRMERDAEMKAAQEAKAQREEAFARREREIDHKVGLLKIQYAAEKAQDKAEVVSATREAKLEAKEEVLQAKAKVFEEQMMFVTKRFETEIGSTKELLKQIIASQEAKVVAVSGGSRVAVGV